jgi:heme exporter protein A
VSGAPALVGQALSCVRDGRMLFHALEVSLAPGQVLRIEGYNGAGKTSLLRILCGLSEPREGSVCWRGADIRNCRPDYHQALLYIGHNPGIKQELTPLENLRFFRALSGQEGGDAELLNALELIGLYGYEDVKVGALSAGQRRRAALARLWLNRAPLWMLDEPFTAIDRQGISNLETRLADHVQAGGMVVVTSHQHLQVAGCAVQALRLQ